MDQNKPSVSERIAALMIMTIFLLPLGILCYIAYGDIMIIYTRLTDASSFADESLGTFIMTLIFFVGIGCITVPLSILGIVIWIIAVYQIITQKDLSFNNDNPTDISNNVDSSININNSINTIANKIHIPKLSHYYNGTIHILTREQKAHADENINTGEDYQYKLKTLARNIGDPTLQRQLYKMEAISTNILKYLKSNPENASLANQFIDYYLKETVNFVNHYIELEKSNLNTSEIITTKNNIKNIINKFEGAYKNQFSKLIENRLIDINAEIIVARKMLKEIGITSPNREAGE